MSRAVCALLLVSIVGCSGPERGGARPHWEGGPAPFGLRSRLDLMVEVCRNNQFIYSKPGQGKEMAFTFKDETPPQGHTYYYLRVLQKDHEIAWSSPVWLVTE